jgi:hypothetical protein
VINRTRIARPAWALVAAVALPAAASAEIYSCTDALGRRHTADRPIDECSARVQVQLNPSGTVRRVLQPGPTVAEQMLPELHATLDPRLQTQTQQQLDRALLRRYPTEHDFEQQRALAVAAAAPEGRAGLQARFDSERARLKLLWHAR